MDNQEKNDQIWEYLNEEGIFTMDELLERIRTMSKINIALFVNPIEGKGAKC